MMEASTCNLNPLD